jgi:formylglycine-generating enzyme required for sulfatase activity
MGSNPSEFQGDAQRPVENVSWDDCQEYCGKLSERFPRLGAGLPTEGEWEYACRAGTTGAYNDGSDCTAPEGCDPALEKLGWFDKNSEGTTHPVRQKTPNRWGLYDMHGNVWEWTSTPNGPVRVIRGGSWFNPAQVCQCAFRFGRRPSVCLPYLGLRVVAGEVSRE